MNLKRGVSFQNTWNKKKTPINIPHPAPPVLGVGGRGGMFGEVGQNIVPTSMNIYGHCRYAYSPQIATDYAPDLKWPTCKTNKSIMAINPDLQSTNHPC